MIATPRSTHVLAARSARAFHEMTPISYTPADPGRVYRKIPYGPMLGVFFLDLLPGSAQLSRSQQRRDAGHGRRRLAGVGRGTDRMAEAGTGPVQGHLEGDPLRHADRAVRMGSQRRREAHRGGFQRRQRSRQGPRAGIRGPAALHQDRRDQQHGLADGGRALHRRSLLQPEQGISTRSGSSSPVRCTQVPSARTIWTARSARK